MENVLANADKISGKALREKVQNNKESALLSKKLATIFTDVPVDADLANYELKALKPERANCLPGWNSAICTTVLMRYGRAGRRFQLFGDFVEDKLPGCRKKL